MSISKILKLKKTAFSIAFASDGSRFAIASDRSVTVYKFPKQRICSFRVGNPSHILFVGENEQELLIVNTTAVAFLGDLVSGTVNRLGVLFRQIWTEKRIDHWAEDCVCLHSDTSIITNGIGGLWEYDFREKKSKKLLDTPNQIPKLLNVEKNGDVLYWKFVSGLHDAFPLEIYSLQRGKILDVGGLIDNPCGGSILRNDYFHLTFFDYEEYTQYYLRLTGSGEVVKKMLIPPHFGENIAVGEKYVAFYEYMVRGVRIMDYEGNVVYQINDEDYTDYSLSGEVNPVTFVEFQGNHMFVGTFNSLLVYEFTEENYRGTAMAENIPAMP